MDNMKSNKLSPEELKNISGGHRIFGDIEDWIITCDCGYDFLIHGLQGVVFCPWCREPINVENGEGNPKRL